MSTRYFRKEKGELVNLIDHTIEMIASNPNLRMYIGTDSQSYGDKTIFATCVVYRWSGLRGAHYIYIKDEVPRIKDEYMRLYQEGVKTLEILAELDEIPIKVEGVEFDYADVNKTISSQLVSTFKGWCEGIGQKAVFKSGEMIATRAADKLVKK